MNISGKTKLCVIIGDPVEHSLSPAMHNAGYEALGIDDTFAFVAAHVKPEGLNDVVQGVRAMGVRGLTCTIPHKVDVMHYLDAIDPVAQKIGAVNTIVNNNGILTGYNTDWLGVVTPLEQITSLRGKKVALIGAGGAARAMAYGVTERGAKLVIFNRSLEKAKELATSIGEGIEVHSIQDMNSEALQDVDIILNATSMGMESQINETPVPKEFIQPHHIVFDAVYVPSETRLLREAQEQGATIIRGIEMLLYQGVAQFELYTGDKAPVEIMRQVLTKHNSL